MNPAIRHIEPHTLETLLLVGALVLIAVAKSSNESKFNSFIGLFLSYRFLKLYSKESSTVSDRFNLLLFLAQVVSFGLFFYCCLDYFDISIAYGPLMIIAFLMLFILFKTYLEKTIAAIFSISSFAESYQFHKLTYRNLLALIMLPFSAFYLYSELNDKFIISGGIIAFICLNILTLGLTLRNHQKSISRHVFYFILYLCALEIAPYLILIKFLFLDKA
ncbi:DUF4271 domain-containing protein [Robertkochia aurantiaca]|uniref:DUF4271 domain-containing protein n=1 Tax=Robertkochia aurantiaca TaxID=2873700 RepID=UPI001CCEB2EC|nr:DUF4271 domain-containing protein [Robertkochia sp. 3YJGBD-33]